MGPFQSNNIPPKVLAPVPDLLSPIPKEWMDGTQKCAQTIDISSNRISNLPTMIEFFPLLKKLVASSNLFTSFPQSLANHDNILSIVCRLIIFSVLFYFIRVIGS